MAITIYAIQEILTRTFLRPRARWSAAPQAEVAYFLEISDDRLINRRDGPILGVAVGPLNELNDELAIHLMTAFDVPKLVDLVGEALAPFEYPIQQTIVERFEGATRSPPVKGGYSIGIGQKGGATGTLGCAVKDSSGSLFALSCNHVIANYNAGTRGVTNVWAPGPKDKGTSADYLGVLHNFAQIDFSRGAVNRIDAALARPDEDSDLDINIHGIGKISGWTSQIQFGDRVRKSGAKSKVSDGRYRYRINTLVNYDNGSSALFEDLLGIVGTSSISNFAQRGDSGAVVIDDQNTVVAQIISVASGIDLTLASPIEEIVNYFGVEPAT